MFDEIIKSQYQDLKEFLKEDVEPRLKNILKKVKDIDNIDVVEKDGSYFVINKSTWEKIIKLSGIDKNDFDKIKEEFKKIKEDIKKDLKILRNNIPNNDRTEKEVLKYEEDKLKEDIELLKLLKENKINQIKDILKKRWIKVNFSLWYENLKEKIINTLISGKISLEYLKNNLGEEFLKDLALTILDKKRNDIIVLTNKYFNEWKKEIVNWKSLKENIKQALMDLAFLKALTGLYSKQELYLIVRCMGIGNPEEFIYKFWSFSFNSNNISILEEYIKLYGINSPIRQYRSALIKISEANEVISSEKNKKSKKDNIKSMWSIIKQKWLFGWVDSVVDRLENNTKISEWTAEFLRLTWKIAVLIWFVKLLWEGINKVKWLDAWRKKLIALGGFDILYNVGTWHHLWELSYKLFTGWLTEDYYKLFSFSKNTKDANKARKEYLKDEKIIELVNQSVPDVEKISLIVMWFPNITLKDFFKYKTEKWWDLNGLKEYIKNNDEKIYYYIFDEFLKNEDTRNYLINCLDVTYNYFKNYSNNKETLKNIFNKFEKRYNAYIQESRRLSNYLKIDCRDDEGKIDKICNDAKGVIISYLEKIKKEYLTFKVESIDEIKKSIPNLEWAIGYLNFLEKNLEGNKNKSYNMRRDEEANLNWKLSSSSSDEVKSKWQPDI
jgi:hypothetical protein